MAGESPKLQRWGKGPSGFMPIANRQLDEIEQQFERLPGPARQLPGAVTGPIFAKITAVDVSTGEFTGEQVNPDGSTITGGLTFDGSGSNPPKIKATSGIPWVPVGSIWRVTFALDSGNSDAPQWWCEGTRPHDTFAVDLTEDGSGSAGNKTTACTFTYTVADKDANTLGTSISPETDRPTVGKLAAATKGQAYYLADGTLKLLATEPDAKAACT